MKYIIRETYRDERLKKTAGVKAREDFETIAGECGYKIIDLPILDENVTKSHLTHFAVYKTWREYLPEFEKGDSLFLQMPFIRHSVFIQRIIKQIRPRVKVYVLIHDLELLRLALRDGGFFRKTRINYEEKEILKLCTAVIAHNSEMKKKLIELGIPGDKIVVLEIFDYLTHEKVNEKCDDDAIIIAGNLRQYKAGYVYDLPKGVRFNLYGIDYEGDQNELINYHGSYPPDILPSKVKGAFGLVWDGSSGDTCTGVYGEYLKINNPHKTSFYLACGIPVVIWGKAALAQFVLENNCGIVIDSLDDLRMVQRKAHSNEYNILKTNAINIAYKLREGYYSRRAICEVEKM